MSRSSGNNTLVLLIAFGCTLFLAANLIGMKTYMLVSAKQSSTLRDLKDQVAQNNEMISLRDLWMERSQLMEAHPVPQLAPASAGAEFLQSLQQVASSKGVRILDQSFGQPGKANEYETVSVRLKTAGTMEAMARWLFEIQKEGSYRALPEMTLRSDKEPPNVLCDLQIVQYFTPLQSSK